MLALLGARRLERSKGSLLRSERVSCKLFAFFGTKNRFFLYLVEKGLTAVECACVIHTHTQREKSASRGKEVKIEGRILLYAIYDSRKQREAETYEKDLLLKLNFISPFFPIILFSKDIHISIAVALYIFGGCLSDVPNNKNYYRQQEHT